MKYERICKNSSCNKPFIAKSSKGVYCSQGCRTIDWQRNKRIEAKRLPKIVQEKETLMQEKETLMQEKLTLMQEKETLNERLSEVVQEKETLIPDEESLKHKKFWYTIHEFWKDTKISDQDYEKMEAQYWQDVEKYGKDKAFTNWYALWYVPNHRNLFLP